MESLSVVLVARNEEHNIDRCLVSVAWADEIVVVDSFSTDGTVARARAHTDKVYRHEYPGYSRQVERAVGYAQGDWVLILDADEVVGDRLAEQIRAVLAAADEPDRPVGYVLRRELRAYGAPVAHGGQETDWPLRLFRRTQGRPLHREIHGSYTVDGPCGRLDGGLRHESYDHLYAHVARVNDYTSLEVANRLERNPAARVRWWNVFVNPLGAFLRAYVARGGWRDGFAGFSLALMTALYTQLTYLKLWEHRRREHEGGDRRPPIRAAEVTAAKLRL